METFSAKYIAIATVAIIAGNAVHRWLVRPTLQSVGVLS